MTKKEAKANKAAWNLALAEGRVVKLTETTWKAYATAEEAKVACDLIEGAFVVQAAK